MTAPSGTILIVDGDLARPATLAPLLEQLGYLQYLAERASQICSGHEIRYCTHALNTDAANIQKLLHSHTRNIRKKTPSDHLINDHSSGYMLVNPHKNR